MRFTILLPDKTIHAKYVIHLCHFEFDDGRPPLRRYPRRELAECLRWEFPQAWVFDRHGRCYEPLASS
jgi:hypothetical protein